MARPSSPCWSDSFDFLPAATRSLVGVRAASIVPFLTSLVVPITLGLAITPQSLWTDEGFTVWFASHRSFPSFFHALVGRRGAPGDPQFLFYLLHMWGWIKVFGSSELSLRAANIPFAVIFIYAMRWASQHLFWNRHLWVLFCLSPFFWFYLNEARPYIALLSFASVATVALVAFLLDSKRYGKIAPGLCLLALFSAWGVHILAVFLFPTVLILILITVFGDPDLKSDFFRYWTHPALWCAPLFFALGGFYFWVSFNGVNKSEAIPGWRNLAFALYEFAGFAGLGPPRNDIRETPGFSVFFPYWPWLLLGTVSLAAVILYQCKALRSRIPRNILISATLGLLIALGVSVFEHFQILGRHLAVFLPLIIVVVMLDPRHSLRPPTVQRGAMVAVIALGVVWGISDLRLVFLNKYAKDSYREACSIALSRAGEDGAVILWAADPVTAEYYGLAVTPRSGSILGVEPEGQRSASARQAIAASDWSAEQANAYFANSSVPIILVLGKSDPFDPSGAWRARIQAQTPASIAHLNTLSIYEWRLGTDAICNSCSVESPHKFRIDQTSKNELPPHLLSLGSSSRAKVAP